MSWWSVSPLLLFTIGLLFVPGAIVALASRIRGVALFAIAPALSVTIVAVSALIAPLAGMEWSLFPVLLLTAVLAAVAVPAAWWTARPGESRKFLPGAGNWRLGLGHAIAVLIAAFLIGRRLVGAFGRPESFSQTFDNVFHLNAVRYILDTGSGSSITVSSMTGGDFYPAAWHDLVALLAATTGADITVSVNVVNLIVASVCWPLGCIFLAHQLLGKRVVVSVAAGILSAAFGAFPLLLLDFGVLYPNFLGNALLPVAVALGVQALGLTGSRAGSTLVNWLLFIAVLPGVTLAHPSSTMALLALMIPPLVILWTRFTAKISRGSRHRAVSLVGAFFLLLLGLWLAAVAWKNVRPPEIAAFWPPVETTGRAIGEVLTSSAIGRSVSWAVMVLAVAGLIVLIVQRRHLWLVGMYGVIASLFVIVASFPFGELRTFLTGVWYNDPPRLASLLPLVTLPLAVVGAVHAWDKWVAPLGTAYLSAKKAPLSAHLRRVPGYVGLSVAGLACVLLVFSTQQANVREAAISASEGYRLAEDSPLISSDEMALLKRLPEKLPEDATLLGNPWNGSALAYAFTGRDLVQLHMLSEMPAGLEQLYTSLNKANSDPSVCPIVERLQVDYVLDFGHGEVHGGDNGFRGLDNLEAAGVAKLVDAEGEAKVYELIAC
ncbi:DUF6541 family protein [Pseudarthrobacter oxydans]|uniref:DUF6541 family protein n=1 Tax=Pseudarthrobacter oxydans TaxID=1671 RepID=UPI003420C41B